MKHDRIIQNKRFSQQSSGTSGDIKMLLNLINWVQQSSMWNESFVGGFVCIFDHVGGWTVEILQLWMQWQSEISDSSSSSLFQAVCCADHEHCCPQGYSCNMQTGTCEKKNHHALVYSLPQSRVVQSEPRDPEEDVPCDRTGEFRCPARDTCCRISASEWACCPSPRVRPHQRFMFDHCDLVMSREVAPLLARPSGMWIMWPGSVVSHDPSLPRWACPLRSQYSFICLNVVFSHDWRETQQLRFDFNWQYYEIKIID